MLCLVFFAAAAAYVSSAILSGNAYFQWVSQRAIFLFLFFQMVATLPINLVPVAGTICYAGLNGTRTSTT